MLNKLLKEKSFKLKFDFKKLDKRLVRILVLIPLFFILFFMQTPKVFGVTRTWDGEGSTNNWSEAANWSGNTVPGSGDLALFNGTSTKDATIDGGYAGNIGGVSIASGYTGTITQARSLIVGSQNFSQADGTWDGGAQTLDINDGSFTVSGGVHTATTGTWTLERNFTHSGGTLTMTGATVAFDGANDADDSTLTCSGSLGGTVNLAKTNGGDFTLISDCNANVGSINTNLGGCCNHWGASITINGTMNHTGSTFNVDCHNAGSNGSYPCNFTISSSGTVTYSGTSITIEGNFTQNGTFDLTGKTITLDGTDNNDDSTLTCSGSLGGTVNLSKSEGGDFTLSSGCTANVGSINTTLGGCCNYWGGNITINGTMNHTGSTFNVDCDDFEGDLPCGFTINSGGTVTYSGTNITIEGSFTQNGTFDMSGITLTFDGAHEHDDSPLTCSGSLGGTVNISKTNGGDFTLASGCTANVGSINTTLGGCCGYYGGSITINGTMNHTGSTFNVDCDDFDGNLPCDFTIGNTGTVTYSGTTITMEGHFTQNGTFDMSGITLTFDGADEHDDSTLTCSDSFGGTVNIAKNEGGDFTLASGCTANVGSINTTLGGCCGFFGADITINGTMNHTGSTFNIDCYSNASYCNFIINNGGTVTYSGTNITIEGNFTLNGDFNLTGKTVTFDGSDSNDDSTLTCSGSLGGMVNITKSNSNNDGNFTLGSGCNVTLATNVDTTGSITINGSASGTNANTESHFTLNTGGTFTLSGNLTFDGTSSADDSTIVCGTGTIINSNVVINKTNSGGETTIGSDCTITGNFTRTDGPVLNPTSTRTLTIQGNFSMSTTDTFGGNNLTLEMGGTSNQTITQNAGTMSGHFRVNKLSGTASLSTSFTTGSVCDVSRGTFDINGQTFTCGSTFTVQGETSNPDVSSNLYAYWNMNETSGTNVADTSGNSRNATATGTSVVSGKINNARSFNGTSSDYISAPTGQFDNFTAGFTASVWANPTASNNYARFIDFAQGQSDDNILFARRSTTSDLVCEAYNNLTTGGQVIATGALTNNEWHHYVCTINSSGNVRIYKDGVPIANGTTAAPNNVTRDSSYLGRSNWAADAYYAGHMDDVKIFDRSLSESEVAYLYSGNISNLSGTLELFGSETITSPTLEAGSTVRYTGDGDTVVDNYTLKDLDYHHLTIASVDSGDTFATPNTTEDVNGNFALSTGTFTAPSGNFSIGGNFAHTGGTFTHNSGTVIFDDNSKNTTVYGDTTFFNFSSTTAGKTIILTSGSTQTISNSFTITGNSSSPIILKGQSPPTQWNIISNGTESVSYSQVRDSDACGGNTIAASNSVNLGNNECWSFTTNTPGDVKINGGTKLREGTKLQGN